MTTMPTGQISPSAFLLMWIAILSASVSSLYLVARGVLALVRWLP